MELGQFEITVYQDEDVVFIAECPDIPGCISQGETEELVLENIAEAIEECLEVRKDRGFPAISGANLAKDWLRPEEEAWSPL